ncbi:MAG: hypothetical protein IKR51_06590, partial [Oscillospiraceae bacterium]|nr:hypothetical protein [Oscillospiraceae bacterium]
MEERKNIIYICPKCGAVGAGDDSGASCYKCGHSVMHPTTFSQEEWLALPEEKRNDAIRIASAHTDNAMMKVLTESREELSTIRKWVMFLGIVVIVQIVA